MGPTELTTTVSPSAPAPVWTPSPRAPSSVTTSARGLLMLRPRLMLMPRLTMLPMPMEPTPTELTPMLMELTPMVLTPMPMEVIPMPMVPTTDSATATTTKVHPLFGLRNLRRGLYL